jgi:hypothetical protein
MSIWHSLYKQRLEHRMTFASSERIAPSRHLAATARGAIDEALSQNLPMSRMPLVSVWLAAVEFALTLYRAHGESNRTNELDELVSLFCYAHHVFRDDWVDALKTIKLDLRSDANLAANIAHALVLNGVDSDAVHAGFLRLDVNLKREVLALDEWIKAAGLDNKNGRGLGEIRSKLKI